MGWKGPDGDVIDSSYWIGCILSPDRKALGLVGLIHLGGARHFVWLASTPELYRHPSSLVRSARRWLRNLQTSLHLEIVAAAPPSYKKVPRLLKAMGFSPDGELDNHQLFVLN